MRINLFFYRAAVYCFLLSFALCGGSDGGISECRSNASCAPPIY